MLLVRVGTRRGPVPVPPGLTPSPIPPSRHRPRMPNHSTRVLPFGRVTILSDAGQLVADVAFHVWLSPALSGGSPDEAPRTAVRMVKGTPAAGLFLAPKR